MTDGPSDDSAARAAQAMFARDAASQRLGMTIEVTAAGSATAHMVVTEDMLNGHAVCHGGLIFALADTAFAFACNGYGTVTVASAASIDFLRPAKLGDRLTAHAEERHRGKRSGVYDVRVCDQDGREIAAFRGRSHDTLRPGAA